ncbi:DUF4924 family protein [Reichenbachiella sp. MALMAid0571]|uniref:DUF4924 family protein n=1 Tax=Reichenbachiella sp. MALMAid0571 TaxID=3143939 RepID=UPI0032DEC8EB
MTIKKENISEYIIQLYRKEDLVRAFEFDMEKIGTHVINHLPISNIEKLSEVNYYEDLIQKMQDQGIEKEGHLEEAKQLVNALEILSTDLLRSDNQYTEIYEDAKPAIDENIELSRGVITSNIQICLNGIYGFLLLRLNGRKMEENDQNKIEKFGNVLSYLSMKYQERFESN